ncbi:MAG: hypothetical protein ABR604_03005 [Jatrophihabitantaceae bacterium]
MGVALAVAAAALILVRLGPSLIGARVFLGLDLLYLFAPYTSLPGSHPPTTSIYISDQLDGLVPALHEISQRFLHADIAGWSSQIAGGAPLLATPDFGVISPGRWLYLILPSWLAPGWSKVFEMAFAAAFMYLLVRRLRGSKLAAALAGFICPLTGFMISWTNWPQVAVASIIPMLFWSVERFVQERRLRAAGPVAVACALLIFGGFPAVAGQALFFAAGYALVRLLSVHRSRVGPFLRDASTLAAAVVVGVGLTAAQLLPFAHSVLGGVDLSYRSQGFFDQAPYRHMLTTVFPGTFAGNQLATGASPMDLNAYVGAVVLMLAVLGVVQAISGRISGSAGPYFVGMTAFIVGLIWFQGAWSNWLDSLPVFHGNPIGRIRSQLAVPTAVLAAAGFDMLRGISWEPGWLRSAAPSRWRWPVVSVIVGVTTLVGLLGLTLATGNYAGVSNSVTEDVLVAVIPLVLISILAVLGVRILRARLLALVVVVLSISAQAFAATSFYWPTGSRALFYPTTAGIKYLQDHQGHDRSATFGYAIRPNVTEYYGLRMLNGHSFEPKAMKSVINAVEANAYVAATYSVLFPSEPDLLNSPGLGRLGVRYLVGESRRVVPTVPNSAAPTLGTRDKLPAAAGPLAIPAGAQVSTTVPGGPLLGVDIPLTSAGNSTITVTVSAADGTRLAQNSRGIAAGSANLPVPLADQTGVGRTPAASGPVTIAVASSAPGVLASADGAGHVRVQAVRPSASTKDIRIAFAAEDLVIWERLDYQSRIRWASKVTVVKDDAARLKAVAGAPIEPAGIILAEPAPVGVNGGVPSAFDIVEDDGDTIRVRLDVAKAGYVVVADNIQTDFEATVDGRRAEIVDADYAVGAVYVPAGRHDVSLRYAPRGGRLGAQVSGVSAALLLLLAIPTGWSRRLCARLRPRPRGRSGGVGARGEGSVDGAAVGSGRALWPARFRRDESV